MLEITFRSFSEASRGRSSEKLLIGNLFGLPVESRAEEIVQRALDGLVARADEVLATAQQTQATWKTVPTLSISAGGVAFTYREPGRHNGGTPWCS